MDKNSLHHVIKFSAFYEEFRRSDAALEELQNSVYHTAHESEEDFAVYVGAQVVRDNLFGLVRAMHGIPDETSSDDYDAGGGEVLRTRE